jgi:hypothetical protein
LHYEQEHSPCGGTARGQDGVTIRQQPPVRDKQAPKGAFFIGKISSFPLIAQITKAFTEVGKANGRK